MNRFQKRYSILFPLCLYASAIAALTAGSLFQGILEIYGTSSHLSKIFWLSCAVFLLTALFIYLTAQGRRAKKRPR